MDDKYSLFLEYRSDVEHFLIDDGHDFDFCAVYISYKNSKKSTNGNESITITGEELEIIFKDCYKKEVGIAPFEECPLCGSKTIVRSGGYRGYFIGCTNYPKCNFLASKSKKYNSEKQLLKEEAVIDEAEDIISKEGVGLSLWLYGNIMFLADERNLINQVSDVMGIADDEAKLFPERRKTRMSYKQAVKVRQIYTKAKNLGYPQKNSELYKVPCDFGPYPDESERCVFCGSRLKRRHGRYGFFTCCEKYPECQYIKGNNPQRIVRSFLKMVAEKSKASPNDDGDFSKKLIFPDQFNKDICSWCPFFCVDYNNEYYCKHFSYKQENGCPMKKYFNK